MAFAVQVFAFGWSGSNSGQVDFALEASLSKEEDDFVLLSGFNINIDEDLGEYTKIATVSLDSGVGPYIRVVASPLLGANPAVFIRVQYNPLGGGL